MGNLTHRYDGSRTSIRMRVKDEQMKNEKTTMKKSKEKPHADRTSVAFY